MPIHKEAIKDKADKAEGLKPSKPSRDPGRPTVYKDTFVAQVEKLCSLGATDIEMADFFDVDVRTLYRWKIEFPEFCQAIKNAKEIADERVERSLYQRAMGYTYETEEIFQSQGEIIRAATRKHVPPDTVAMIFWLKNRRPAVWRDIQKHEHGNAGDFDKLSVDELRASIARDLEAVGSKDLAAALPRGTRQTNGSRRPN